MSRYGVSAGQSSGVDMPRLAALYPTGTPLEQGEGPWGMNLITNKKPPPISQVVTPTPACGGLFLGLRDS